ncbi:MAG: immune inhibitor A [Candidatus Marinimicrobia bacterium]|nr:immune inhibitor A [Candidatus Neomarinimicrobiota bacterium]
MDNPPYDEYDKIAIIYAGETFYGGGLSPHARYLNDRYYIIGERHQRLNSGWGFTHIGGHCHEFGHCLGLPHLADGSYENANEVDYYALMEVGDMCGPEKNGACPSGINPFYKISNGWVSAENIHYISKNVKNLTIFYNYLSPHYYVIDRSLSGSNKFFILENRLRDGFDYYTPNDPNYQGEPDDPNGNQGGLLVWRVEPTWIHLILADDEISDRYWDPEWENRSYSRDPFPIFQRQDLNGSTVPNNDFRNGSESHYAFQNIVWDNNNKTVSLEVYINASGGEISENTTWEKDVFIYDDITIDMDVTLTIGSGVRVEFAPGTKMIVNGQLVAQGTSNEPIIFTSSKPNPSPGDWKGIRIYGDGSKLRYCEIKYAVTGVRNFKTVSNIMNSKITDCHYGVFIYYMYSNNHDWQYVDNCQFYDNLIGIFYIRNRGSIGGNIMENNSTAVRVYWTLYPEDVSIYHNIIRNCGIGLSFDDAGAMIQWCDIYNNTWGIFAGSYSDIWFREDNYDGKNVIVYNSYCGIRLEDEATANLYRSGSTICSNGTWNLSNWTDWTVNARYNYWGSVPPDPDKFEGDVYYVPYLYRDITGRYPPGLVKEIAKDITDDINSFENKNISVDANIKSLFERAKNFEMEKRYEEAADIFYKIMDRYPDNPVSVLSWKKYMRCKNKIDSSFNEKDLLRDISEKYRDKLLGQEASLYLIGYLISDKNYDKAISICEYLKENSNNLKIVRHALYDLWMIKYGLMRDNKEGHLITDEYEDKCGVDIDLIYMRLEMGDIDIKKAKEMLKMLDKGLYKEAPQPSENFVVIPDSYELKENYPNPFNVMTNIEFCLPEESRVRIMVYDLRGRLIEKIADRDYKAGSYRLIFTGKNYSSGIYILRAEMISKEDNSRHVFTRKIVLLK